MSVHEKKALIKQNFVVVKNNDKEFTFSDRSALLQIRTYDFASLSPTRLVNTSRLWLTTRPLGIQKKALSRQNTEKGLNFVNF